MKITTDTTINNKTLDDIEAENCHVTLIGCQFQHFYALNCVVLVSRCKGQNVGRNFVQLDKCRDSRIEWCEVINESGKTSVEDNINLFETSNTVVFCNYVEGATPSADYSGSGIMVDRGCVNCQINGNVVINTQNAGIGLAGGTGNVIRGNRVFSVGPGVNGNVGIYVNNQYAPDPFSNNGGIGNAVGWLTDKGRNDWWIPGAAYWKNNVSMPKVDRAAEHNLWLRRLRHA